jgi:DNA-binding IclR family transcriptional regulator
MSKPKSTQPIQSLDRGLAILEMVARSRRPVSVAEMTPALGIDRSSVFRLANTLKLRGFLVQLPSKEYVLGSAVWRLSHLFPWGHGLIQIAREHMTALADQTGETTHLVVQEGRKALFIDHELAAQPVVVSAVTGRCEPLHSSAVGKALLVDCDLSALEGLFGNEPLAALTRHTIRTLAELAAECQRARKRGFAVDNEESYEGVRCVAVPIRDASGQVVAAIGVSAPVKRLCSARMAKVAQDVQRAAAQISEKLGYPTKAPKA